MTAIQKTVEITNIINAQMGRIQEQMSNEAMMYAETNKPEHRVTYIKMKYSRDILSSVKREILDLEDDE
jgi:hypothetical protein